MIVGIDADFHRVAWAAVHGGRVVAVETIERSNTKSRMCEGYDLAVRSLFRRAFEKGATVYLEGIFLATHRGTSTKRNVDGFRRLAEMQGELKAAARACGVLVETVQANTWHANMLGFVKGRDELQAAANRLAQEVTGLDDLTDHESDAVCIALWGERFADAA